MFMFLRHVRCPALSAVLVQSVLAIFRDTCLLIYQMRVICQFGMKCVYDICGRRNKSKDYRTSTNMKTKGSDITSRILDVVVNFYHCTMRTGSRAMFHNQADDRSLYEHNKIIQTLYAINGSRTSKFCISLGTSLHVKMHYCFHCSKI